MSIEDINLEGKRVELEDGSVVDAKTGFGCHPQALGTKVFFDDAQGMPGWTRRGYVKRVLGDTPENVTYKFAICTTPKEGGKVTVLEHVEAESANAAEDTYRKAHSKNYNRHLLCMGWDHPAWGEEDEPDITYHILPDEEG